MIRASELSPKNNLSMLFGDTTLYYFNFSRQITFSIETSDVQGYYDRMYMKFSLGF